MLAFRCEQSFVTNPFEDDAVKAIYDASRGVSRDIKIASTAYVLMRGRSLSSVPVESIPSIVKEAKLRD